MFSWLKKIPKKLTVALIGAVVQVLPVLSDDVKQHIIAVAAAYIIGQGIADHGKEAAKVQVAAGAPVAAPVTITGVSAKPIPPGAPF